MGLSKPFFLNAWLPPHAESLSEIAERFASLLGSLSAMDPLLRDWFHPTGPDTCVLLTQDLPSLEKLIYAASCMDDETSPCLDSGFSIVAGTNPNGNSWTSSSTIVMMSAGGRGTNQISLQTPWTGAPDPRLVSYSLTKKMLFALADAFEPMVCRASPLGLDRDRIAPKRTHPILAGWMLLLPEPLARRIRPPAAAITQTRPDGSLFMAAADETFDVDNPDHMALMLAMQDAIAPINDRSLFKPKTAA